MKVSMEVSMEARSMRSPWNLSDRLWWAAQYEYWELDSSPLQDQSVILTDKLSPDPNLVSHTLLLASSSVPITQQTLNTSLLTD